MSLSKPAASASPSVRPTPIIAPTAGMPSGKMRVSRQKSENYPALIKKPEHLAAFGLNIRLTWNTTSWEV